MSEITIVAYQKKYYLVGNSPARVVGRYGKLCLTIFPVKQRAHERQNVIFELEYDICTSKTIPMIFERIFVILAFPKNNCVSSAANN